MPANYATIYTNNDIQFPLQIWTDQPIEGQGGVIYPIPATVTIEAIIVDSTGIETSCVPQSRTAVGADWDNGLVIVEMASTEADLLTVGKTALVQLKLTDSTPGVAPTLVENTQLFIKEGFC